MGEHELASLRLPERYIVSLAHELVDKVTDSLEDYDMVRLPACMRVCVSMHMLVR
jgi:hypothetical protein